MYAGMRLYKSGLICYCRFNEGAPEGQADGVNKTVWICKSPKIDVTSISPTHSMKIKFALQIFAPHA